MGHTGRTVPQGAVPGGMRMSSDRYAGLGGTWNDQHDLVLPISITKILFAGSHAVRPADTVLNVEAADGRRFQLQFAEETLETLVTRIEAHQRRRARM